MRPDIVISRDEQLEAIADCKYKRLDTGEFKWADHYQVLAYCAAMAVDRGMLIYPRHLCDVQNELEIRNSPVTIRQRTIDLDLPWASLVQRSEQLASELSSWVDEPRTAAA